MITLIALVAGLWMLALIVIAASSDSSAAVAMALASDEPIIAGEQPRSARPARPAREEQHLAA